ncbi:hypothetical protein Scep_006712 [Stephania cephalantha]|uniref:Cytochrome P450 n=1 Tax=Stephania cephalantha TaxID=152367 RepID=A0AAP0PN77_9MAGN
MVQMITVAGFVNNLFCFLAVLWTWWWENSNYKPRFITQALVILFTAALVIFWYYMRRLIESSKTVLQQHTSPPGPRGLPLVGNLPFLDAELHTHFADLAQTYGPILKLHLGNKVAIVVSSPSLAKEVLKDHDITFANRDVPAVAKTVEYVSCNIVSSPYGAHWRMLRRLCVAHMLSSTSLDTVYPLRKREVQRMVGEIYGNIGLPVNLSDQLFLTILNVITSMLWGGMLKGEGEIDLGAEFRHVVSEITELLGKPNLSDFIPCLAWLDLQGIQSQIKKLFLKFDRIFNSIIEQRLKMGIKDGEESKDFLQLLLHLQEKQTKTRLTMLHIKAILMDMVVGGTETTSNTVEWAMAELMNNDEIMQRAQEELEIIVGKDSRVEEIHLPRLHFLNAVMKEVLRLHPALPLLVPHCPSSSCKIGGYMVPKGARVFVNVWAIHRDPSIWEKPLDFNPERFLNCERDFGGNNFNYFPFGSGRRICAGISMAERMFMYELATLLHSFSWKVAERYGKVDLKEKFGIVLKKATPLIAVATPRLSNPALYE